MAKGEIECGVVDTLELCGIQKESHRTNSTFGFCRHTGKLKKPKEQFLAYARAEMTEEKLTLKIE